MRKARATNARITPAPRLGDDRHLAHYTARPGEQVFERFEWCAVRWMQLVVRNAPHGLRIKGLGAMFTHYPVETRGKFACSDSFLTKLWSTGAYTLMLCMHDAWEDCPSREQRQWLGDATVENLVGHVAFGPSVAALNAKYLLQAAESQRPDGLTQMFAPGDHNTDGSLIPDWTLQWILNAGDHWRLTGDFETVHTILPSILKALAWFERLLDAHGLVAEMPYWHFMDWAYLGREGEACALNAQLAGAFSVAADLCAGAGWEREAQRLRGRAATIAAALNARHWDERRGAYVDVVDPRTGKQELKISQHANAAMALWCAPPAERIARALDRVTDSKRLTFTVARWIVPTGEELEPEGGVVLANTFYAHFLYEALCKARPTDRCAAHDAREIRAHAGARCDDAVGELRSDREPVPWLLRIADLSAEPARAGRQRRCAGLCADRHRARPRRSRRGRRRGADGAGRCGSEART